MGRDRRTIPVIDDADAFLDFLDNVDRIGPVDYGNEDAAKLQADPYALLGFNGSDFNSPRDDAILPSPAPAQPFSITSLHSPSHVPMPTPVMPPTDGPVNTQAGTSEDSVWIEEDLTLDEMNALMSGDLPEEDAFHRSVPTDDEPAESRSEVVVVGGDGHEE